MTDSPRTGRLTVAKLVTLAALLLSVLGLAGHPAAAQDDPYGSTTTTSPEPKVDVRCRQRVKSGPAGMKATVDCQAVAFGATVEIFIHGRLAGRATAPSTGGGQPPGTTNLEVPIEVPDLDPGVYKVTCSTDNMTRCRVVGGDNFEVTGPSSEDDGFEVLALTGTNILILVAIALALVLIGRRLQKASSRRRATS